MTSSLAIALTLVALTRTSSAGPASDGPPDALPEALPKLTLGAEDNQLRVAFMSQVRFTYADADVSAGPAGTEKVTLQRVRPILVGRLLDGKLGFKLHLNTGPTLIELLDLFADYVFDGGVRLRVGQQKVPFTRYRLNSFSRLALVDWSPAARAFGAERQIGFTAMGGLGEGLRYAAGVYTGSNARAAFETGLARAYGAQLDNPSALADPAAPARIHPELVFHLAWTHGDDGFKSASDAKGGPLRALVGLSGAWDVRPEVTRDFALRLGPELFVKLHGLCFVAVGYLGAFETAAEEQTELGMLGLDLQAAYRFAAIYEVSLRYARVQILEALREDALARAAKDPALPAPPNVAFSQEAALGFNLYLIGHQLKWQSDVALSYAGPGGDPALAVRTQLQLSL